MEFEILDEPQGLTDQPDGDRDGGLAARDRRLKVQQPDDQAIDGSGEYPIAPHQQIGAKT